MQIEIISAKRSGFDSLGEDAQTEVRGIRQSIFYRWPTPLVPAEGKLEWDDDIAILWVQYGAAVLLEAMTWFRQNVTKRPAVPEIRERCRIIRESKTPRGGKPSDPRAFEPFDSFESYDRALKTHLADPNDNQLLPVHLALRDANEFIQLKRAARAAGEKISRQDVRDWWLWRVEATDREWSQIRAKAIAEKKDPSRALIDFEHLELTEILREIA